MRHLKRILTIALCVAALCYSFSVFSFADASENEALKVGVVGKMEPLLFFDDSGNICGVFADMMAYISEYIERDVEYVRYSEIAQVMLDLENGLIDAVLGVKAADAQGRLNVELSREIYAADMCVVSAKSLRVPETSMYGSYQAGTIDRGILDIPEAYSFYSLPNQDAVLNYLINGYADRIFALWDCVSYRLENDGLKSAFNITSGNLSDISFGVAVRKSNIILNSSINRAITALRNDNAYSEILKNWKIQTETEAANIRTAKLLKIIGCIAVGSAFIVFVFSFLNARLRDLVRAKTAELSEKVDALEHSSSLRNALVERSSAGSMVLKLDGSILLMNDAMRKLAGIYPDDIVSNISELSLINKVWDIAPAEMDYPELFTERRNDGQLHTYRYQNHRTARPDERVFIIEDITREEAEKQAAFEEDKNKALNRIIAGLAHEIKNPLTTLKAYAYLAEAPDEDPDFYDSFSKYVPGEINRISNLVESLVNYSRPIRGQKKRVRVSDVSDSCIALSLVTSKNKIPIVSELDRDIYINVNEDQLRQALVNFFLNSIEAVEEARAAGKDNCMIRHSVYRRDGQAVIEVYDSGKGMTEEQVKNCADPFFTTKQTGTGMGLALAKQYVRENNGILEIESQNGEYTAIRMVFAEDMEDE